MKRLAILSLAAGFFWSGGGLQAGNPLPQPTTTGIAPTVPQIPAPVLTNGELVQPGGGGIGAQIRDWLGCGPVHVPGVEATPVTGPRLFHGFSGLSLFNRAKKSDVEPYDPFRARRRWCEDCAPVVRHPLPPLPNGVIQVGWEEGVPAGPAASMPAGAGYRGAGIGSGCSNGSCAGGSGTSGDCWHRIKAWLCFRQTPVHLPCTPTPRITPFYTYFPCGEHGGCAANGPAGGKWYGGPAVAGEKTGTAGVAATTEAAGTDLVRRGWRLPTRGASGPCTPCPATGEAILPGYRLASPELPAVGAPATGPVTSTSYRPSSTPTSGWKPARQNPGDWNGTNPVARPAAQP